MTIEFDSSLLATASSDESSLLPPPETSPTAEKEEKLQSRLETLRLVPEEEKDADAPDETLSKPKEGVSRMKYVPFRCVWTHHF